MTEAQAKQKVIDIALAEVGYHEKASDKNLNSKTANAGSANYTKYGKQMHALSPAVMDYPAAWCDAFVDWCFWKAFGDAAQKVLCGTYDDYTVNSAAMYKKAGRWTVHPAKGYQVFYQRNGGICHTGIVVGLSGGHIQTVEGNASDAVVRRDYAQTDSYIAGYGMPDYSVVTGEPQYVGECTVILPQMIPGNEGKSVKSLQILLNGYGYTGRDGKKLTVDGEFGENTKYAVAKFQTDQGMKDIYFGTVARLTWAALLT